MNPLAAAGTGAVLLVAALIVYFYGQPIAAAVVFGASVLCDLWFIQALRARRAASHPTP